MELIKMLGKNVYFKTDNSYYSGKLITYNSVTLTLNIKNQIQIFQLINIQDLKLVAERKKSSIQSLKEIESDKFQIQQQKQQQVQKLDNINDIFDQYDINFDINVMRPANYDQFKINELLTGKTSNYNFDQYTITLNQDDKED